MGRHKRAETPPDPAGAVRALRSCREFLIGSVLHKTRAFGATYKLASNVLSAIDALADHLTGTKDYFTVDGSVASDARRVELEERKARERGERPWTEV